METCKRCGIERTQENTYVYTRKSRVGSSPAQWPERRCRPCAAANKLRNYWRNRQSTKASRTEHKIEDIEFMWSQGMRYHEIAKYFGVQTESLYRWMSRHNVKRMDM